jgi:hypothetical protein
MLGSPAVEGRWGEKLRTWGLALVGVPLIVERTLLLSRRVPTGSDETLYLIQASDWLGRLTKISFDPHRTRGVPALMYPIVALTEETVAYRILFAALSLVLCWLTYLIGREFMGRVAAGWAALMLGLFSPVLLASVALRPDLPAAVGVAAAFLFYWRRVVHAPPDQPLRGLWPIALAIASVFFFNIAFAAFAGITIAADFLIFRRRDLFRRATIGAAVTLGAVLAPYFIKSWFDHGDPTYTIRRGLGGGGPALAGAPPGYETYANWFFDGYRLFGLPWGIVVIVAVAALAVTLVKGRPIPRRDAAALALWLVVPTVLTARLFHAEERYLVPWLPAFFLTMGLLVSQGMRWAAGRRWATVGIVALLIAGATHFGVAQYSPAARRVDSQTKNFTLIHAVAERLGRETPSDCLIFVRWPREFELHTGCRTAAYTGKTEATLLEVAYENAPSTYFVWWTGLVGQERRQPAYLDGFLRVHATELLFTMNGPGRFGPVYAYRFTG